MQVGPYLHQKEPGVRRMVSEDSGLHHMHPPVTPASIHGERIRAELVEARGSEVHPFLHPPHDPCEDKEVLLLRAHKRLSFEERDHPTNEIGSSRTTSTRLVSLVPRWFSRILPQPSRRWIKSSTSLRSGFWLTWNSGRSCQPTRQLGLRWMETENFPLHPRSLQCTDPAFPADRPHRADCHCSCRYPTKRV